MNTENTSMTVDTSGVDMEAEIRAAEQREAEYLASQRNGHVEEDKPNAEPKAKPENVPDEFWDAEKGEVDWTKLNERLNQSKEEDKPADQDAEVINGVALTDQHSQDFAPFYESFAKDGVVPDDAVKYVKDTFGLDVPKSTIAAYMAGQLAQATGKASETANAIRTEGMAVVGGEQNYSKMSEWALETLSEAEVAEYDAAVNGNDPKVAKLAIQALWNRYRAEGTIEPSRQIGNGRTNPTPGDVYRSVDEIARDTMKSEYQTDPSFRAKVDAKIARSGSLSVPRY